MCIMIDTYKYMCTANKCFYHNGQIDNYQDLWCNDNAYSSSAQGKQPELQGGLKLIRELLENLKWKWDVYWTIRNRKDFMVPLQIQRRI